MSKIIQCEATYSIQPFRVEAILDIAKDTIHVFTTDGAAWEDMEIQLDIQGIGFADVVYEAGDSRYINHKSAFSSQTSIINIRFPRHRLSFLAL